MARDYEYQEGGGGFMMGLLTGTVLGAGIGMLLAPKSGSELRHKISNSAGQFGRAASQQYKRASEVAEDLAHRGKETLNRARDAAEEGSDEARRYAKEARERAEETMKGKGGTSGGSMPGPGGYGGV
jgi:gas vesicle protein